MAKTIKGYILSYMNRAVGNYMGKARDYRLRALTALKEGPKEDAKDAFTHADRYLAIANALREIREVLIQKEVDDAFAFAKQLASQEAHNSYFKARMEAGQIALRLIEECKVKFRPTEGSVDGSKNRELQNKVSQDSRRGRQ